MIDLAKRKNVQIGLTEQDFKSAADSLECEIAAIKAVSLVESGKSGFLPSGRPKILFEGHFFYRFVSKYGKAAIIAKEYPNICYSKWTTHHYLGGEREYDRLRAALDACRKHGIPESAALRSASWGKYQIMGDNFQRAGFDTVYSFVEAMFLSEKEHLNAFCAYIKNTFLDDELRELKFAAFAYGYNGAGYKRNEYDKKMISAYQAFKKAEKSQKPKENDFDTEIINIATPITVPTLYAEDTDVIESIPTASKPANNVGMRASDDAVKIAPFNFVIRKFKHAKEIIFTGLTALGISGTSIAGLYENITSNPMLKYVILAIALISMLVAAVLVIVYFVKHLDFHHKTDLIAKESERFINIEQMRIRSNPTLYNVELE
jgi:hypothetical protein